VNGKAAGESGIVAEFLKVGTSLLAGRLKIFSKEYGRKRLYLGW
jgi:hypothetical protein